MMSDSVERKDVLDLLARGKINIDEAVALLSQGDKKEKIGDDETVYKADIASDFNFVEAVSNEEIERFAAVDDNEIKIEEIEGKTPRFQNDGQKPRWLRIKVSNLDSGKSKVSVNVPFALVKFGLGIARVFSPETERENLDAIGAMITDDVQGLLVDVEDVDSNEHVQIYLD